MARPNWIPWTILLSICRGHGDLTAGPSWLGVRVRPSCDDQDTGCQMIRSRWTKWCGGGGGYYSQETSPLFLIFFLHPPERECGGGCNKWRILKKLLPQKKKRRKKTRDWEIGNPSMWRSNIYINIALTNRFSLMKDFFLLVSLPSASFFGLTLYPARSSSDRSAVFVPLSTVVQVDWLYSYFFFLFFFSYPNLHNNLTLAQKKGSTCISFSSRT